MDKTEIGTCKDCRWWVPPLDSRKNGGICADLTVAHQLQLDMPYTEPDFGCIHWAENSATKQEEE